VPMRRACPRLGAGAGGDDARAVAERHDVGHSVRAAKKRATRAAVASGCSSVRSCPESATIANVAPRMAAARARGAAVPSSASYSPGEHQRRRRDAREGAARVVHRGRQREPCERDTGARPGVGERLDPARSVGVRVAELTREDAVDQARLDLAAGSSQTGCQREAAAQARARQREPAGGRRGDAQIGDARRREDREIGGDHAAQRDAEDLRARGPQVIEQVERVACEAPGGREGRRGARASGAAVIEGDDSMGLGQARAKGAPQRHRSAERAQQQHGSAGVRPAAGLIGDRPAVGERGEAGLHRAHILASIGRAMSSSADCIAARTRSRTVTGSASGGAGIGSSARNWTGNGSGR
jgi:hypothetical protein